MLFIDGSHISKTGSDVNHLFLRILPRLPPGVVVHIHDICLPFEYPRHWSEDVLLLLERAVRARGAARQQPRSSRSSSACYFLQKTDIEAAPAVRARPSPGVFPGGGSLWMRIRE